MNILKKLVPTKIKSPIALFFREVGKCPLRLVWGHMRRAYIEDAGTVSQETREKIYHDVHMVTLRYLDNKYGNLISKNTEHYISGTKLKEPIVWVFWWQGEANAPDIIKRCIASIRRNARGMNVRIIDSENYQKFVSVPEHILKKLDSGIISFTHFSDYYRMSLLAAHGGMWIDASVYVKGQLPQDINDMPIYTVRNPGGDMTNISNWEWTVGVIAGWKGNTLFCSVKELMDEYWKEHDFLVDYFLFDYMIRLVVSKCEELYLEICKIPTNNTSFMYLQNHFGEPADACTNEFLSLETVLYKTSYKGVYPKVTEDGKETVYLRWLLDNPCDTEDADNMEKVSIIIPVYNVEQYLSQCLDCIVRQSYTHWEAILIDDGSSDQSGKICDMYAQRDERFIVIHQKNSGAACAKNIGLDNATGRFIAFVDSDDYVEPDWLATIVFAAQKYSADVVEFDFDKIYQNKSERINSYSEEIIFPIEKYLEQYIQVWTSSLFWNKLFRSELLEDIRFKIERRCIDDEFFTYKALTNAEVIIRIPNILYHYRQRANSAVYNLKNQNQIANDSLDVLIERYIWICSYFPKLRCTYLQHDIEVLFYFTFLHHTDATIRKFRSISRFYLRQVLRYPVDVSLFITAIRLQFISKKALLKPHHVLKNNQNIEDYFV